MQINAIQAMRVGKHILVEKPLCTDLQEAREILAVEKPSSIKATVGYHLRWHKGLRALKNLLAMKESDQVFHMNINWAHAFIDEAKCRKDKEQAKWWCF